MCISQSRSGTTHDKSQYRPQGTQPVHGKTQAIMKPSTAYSEVYQGVSSNVATQMMDRRINSVAYVKVQSEPIKFLLSISPSTKMGDRTRQKKSMTLLDKNGTHDSGFDRPFQYRLTYNAREEHVVRDNGGNCGNVNAKGTNACCASSTKDTNDGSENKLCSVC